MWCCTSCTDGRRRCALATLRRTWCSWSRARSDGRKGTIFHSFFQLATTRREKRSQWRIGAAQQPEIIYQSRASVESLSASHQRGRALEKAKACVPPDAHDPSSDVSQLESRLAIAVSSSNGLPPSAKACPARCPPRHLAGHS